MKYSTRPNPPRVVSKKMRKSSRALNSRLNAKVPQAYIRSALMKTVGHRKRMGQTAKV